MKVNILGIDYKIIVEDSNTPGLHDEQRMGYCFFDMREIHVSDLGTDQEWKDEPEEARKQRTRLILRHEIIHAFLNESGLCQSSNECEAWAMNEEMVDWLAIQFPKIKKVFEEVGCM